MENFESHIAKVTTTLTYFAASGNTVSLFAEHNGQSKGLYRGDASQVLVALNSVLPLYRELGIEPRFILNDKPIR